MKIENRLKDFLHLSVIKYENIKIIDGLKLQNHINSEIIKIKDKFLVELPAGFSNSRKLYRAFKIDPTKYRPSSEALWRRVKKGLPFPDVNPFVNSINFLSLKFQTSFGLYDCDKIEGNIIADIGNEPDRYEGIRKDIINLKGKIVLKDSIGAFGNPSSDSLRTSTDDNTKNILVVIFHFSEDKDIERIALETKDFFSKYFSILFL